MQSVDIVIPIFNEEWSLFELAERIRSSMDASRFVNWRVIFVENGSSDNSHQLISQIVRHDSRFSEVRLLRNFGMEGAILAGFSVSEAHFTVTMQGDLEDPPETIPQLLDLASEGYDVVFGEVTSRSDASLTRKLFTKLFYSIGSFLTGGQIKPNASDFRVISRSVKDFINQNTDQNLFLRTLVMWPSDRIGSIPFERGSRQGGQSSFSIRRLLEFSVLGIFGQSLKPLRLITFLGIAGFVVSMLGLLGLVIRAFFWSVPFSGFGTIVGFQLLFFSVTILAIGVTAEYVAMILKEVRPRPRFIIIPSSNND